MKAKTLYQLGVLKKNFLFFLFYFVTTLLAVFSHSTAVTRSLSGLKELHENIPIVGFWKNIL